MENSIPANDLKTKGVTAISQAVTDHGEAIITVRGKDTYVVLPIQAYNHLRVCELEAALQETREDLKNGKFIKESVAAHMKRIARA
jgi:hypothetical protein